MISGNHVILNIASYSYDEGHIRIGNYIYIYELSMTTGSYLEMHQSDLSEIIAYIATNNMD